MEGLHNLKTNNQQQPTNIVMKKQNNTPKPEFLFGKKNYIIMLIGLVSIILGFALMSGGGSDDPNVFNQEIYNWRRIRLAPTLVIIGLGIQIYAILTNPKK